MNFDRRTLLQGLLTLGLGQLGSGFLPMGKLQRYQQALALPTPRKLALLIGINQYDLKGVSSDAIADWGGNLAGAVTDVERQRELLIERYGFQSQDIVTLTDGKAGRAGIQAAFQSHLQSQAQAGDLVVVHFSGYGSRVQSSEGDGGTLSQDLTLLPTDTFQLSDQVGDRGDLLRSTFLDWGKNLTTDNVTYVLDTSHGNSQQKYEGNLRIRAYGNPAANLHPLEISENSAQFSDRHKSFNGTLLTAALPDQVAVEILGENWGGGLFSYVLTRYLWESSAPNRLYFVLHQINNAIADVIGMKQQSQGELGNKKNLLIYGALPETSQGAEAVVTQVLDTQTVALNLTGFPLAVLEGATLHSCLQSLSGAEPVLLQITERSGLQAKATALTTPPNLETGQFLQESHRFIPKQLGLTLALDPRLDRVERVDATSALEPLDSVTKVVKAHSTADCLLGKTETGAYALFSLGGELLFAADAEAGQAIKSAIGELEPALKKQLALKWARLTENEQSSTLGIKVSLETRQDSPQTNLSLAQRHTHRAAIAFPKMADLNTAPHTPLPIKAGTQIQYRLENYGEKPLYCCVLGQDTNGKAIALLQEEQTIPLPPQQTLIIPPPESAIAWRLISGGGISRIQVVASHHPFSQTQQALRQQLPKSLAKNSLNNGQIIEIPQLLPVVQALLEDLQQPPPSLPPNLHFLSENYVLNLQTWATLTFCYRVV